MTAPNPSPVEPPRRPDQFPQSGRGSLPGPWTRIGARLFDLLVLGIPGMALMLPFVDFSATDLTAMTGDIPLWAVIAAAFVPFVYDAVFVALVGRTPGKMLLGTRVVRYVDGTKPTVSQAILRSVTPVFGNLVSLGFPLGGLLVFWEPVVYFSTFWNPLRRGLHDKAAGTIVIHD
ncbi:MAG: RDD family protein [Actinobacteria bacterium]|nr:RDD family protein [Actinomycetota bacterium]